MQPKEKILFITDERYVNYEIAGGVQLCTKEFIKYFELANLEVIVFKVKPVISFFKKLKLKLGIEAYELYNITHELPEIIHQINTEHIKLVAFNQLNIAHWSARIKNEVKAEVKFIGLSHGNESGDYLHELPGQHASILKTWRLGRLLLKEKQLLSQQLDGVVTISAQETGIDQWLGARKICYLPRILKAEPLAWQPVPQVIGFVGTLDHLPNVLGISKIAEKLKLRGFTGELRLVGGPAQKGDELRRQYPFINYKGMLSEQEFVEEVKTWSLFINPVFWYARGSSTKVAQVINWGLPLASTPAGVRGYDLINTTFLSEGNDPESLSQLILNTIASAETLQLLQFASAENAASFDVLKWAEKLNTFLKEL